MSPQFLEGGSYHDSEYCRKRNKFVGKDHGFTLGIVEFAVFLGLKVDKSQWHVYVFIYIWV